MKSFVGIVLVGFAMLGCTGEPSSPPSPGVQLPLSRLATQSSQFLNFSGLNTSARLIIRDPLAWRGVWNDLYRRGSEVPPLPAVDFANEEILIAALGERGSSGYSIVFEGASANDKGEIDVVVHSGAPGKNCPALTVLTQPVDIARIPKTTATIRFVEKSGVTNCGQ